MPWSHCQASEILDTDSCPQCGISKEAWTVEIEVTRVFQVSRAPSLRITLLDEEEEGVAHEPYRVELPDAREIEGKLDERGFAKIVHSQQGECTVTFPIRSRTGVVVYDPDAEPESEAETETEPRPSGSAQPESESESEDDEDPHPTFQVDALGRHRFQLHRVLQLTLVDERWGWPLRFASYTAEDAEGNSYEGETDHRGRLDHGAVPGRWLTLTVSLEIDPRFAVWRGGEARYQANGHTPGATEPETLTATRRVPTVPPDQAFLEVPVPGMPLLQHLPPDEEDRPGSFGMRFCRFDVPLANEPFAFVFGEEEIEGELDDEGWARFDLPEGVEEGEVWVGPNGSKGYYRLQIGELDTHTDVRGAQQRLNNLGYFCGNEDGDAAEMTAGALKQFQAKHELDQTGELDEATHTKLNEIHGS